MTKTATVNATKLDENDIPYIVTRAHMAGLEAGDKVVPKVFDIVDMEDRVIDTLEDGLCGFAWVTIKPNRGPLVAYLKKNQLGQAAYQNGGGFIVWIDRYNQSVTRKYAYAVAFARVLQSHGVNAVAGSRLD